MFLRKAIASLVLFAFVMSTIAHEKQKDASGDELPAGVFARLGTVRLRGRNAEYTPDGTQIATVTRDGVRFWDVKTGELRRHIPMTERPWLLAFSSDGAQLAASRDGGIDIEVWDVRHGKRLHAITTSDNNGRSFMGPRTHNMVFSADGKKLITGGDHFVCVWDLQNGKNLTLHTYAQDIEAKCNTVVISPDGRYLVTGSDGKKTLWLWDVATGKQRHKWEGETGCLFSAAFSPDGKTLATGWDDGKVRLWDVESRKPAGTITTDCTVESVTFSPDGKMLVIALNRTTSSRAGKQQLLLCDPNKRKVIKTLDAPNVRRVLFCPKGRTLAWESDGGAVTLLDATTHQELHAQTGHRAPVLCVTWSRDGKWIATAGDNDVRIWDVNTSKTVHLLRRHRDAVRSLAFSLDGKLLVSGGRDHNIIVWNLATGKPVWESDRHRNWINAVAFSPDSKTIFVGGDTRSVNCFNATTGKHLRDLIDKTSDESTAALAVSPDGTLVCGQGTVLRLWDVQKGSVEAILPKGKQHNVTSLAISPDGKSLAIGCNNKLFVEDLKTGKEITTLPGHSNRRGALAFSPDGKYLASACDGRWESAGKNLHVWDTKTWKDLRPANFPERLHVHSVAISADSRYLVIGTEDTTATVWKIEN